MDSAEYSDRIVRAAAGARAHGIDSLLISPGPDLRYLTGYDAVALERLTCLIVHGDGNCELIAPRLEVPAAAASPVARIGIGIIGWDEGDDPYALVASRFDGDSSVVAVDDRMWAVKALALADAIPGSRQVAAGPVISELRMRKSPAEVEALLAAGAAIDTVHARVPDWLQAGRTEAQVGREIADAISEQHETVDFVIVASGPNGASPHHSCSDRVLENGDAVVVDIGGTTAAGYCSDSTRTYSVGEPDPEFVAEYEVLQRAQATAVSAARPGITCEALDAVSRDILSDAGLGDLFIHRTGHGIGLETHEEPYIVAGNARPLESGMAFSIEPGFYRPGKWGARIEDIVVCTDDGPVLCNRRPRDLIVVDA
ncbi:MAG: M24 family metallopeptidase [Candidatus Nanopelagicales bacterium]